MLDFLKKIFTGGGGGGSAQLKQVIRVSEKNPMARLSQQAYNPNHDEVDKQISDTGYKVDRELSTPDATVFNKNGEAVIAYRGTNWKNLDDLAADAHIAFGSRKHKRFEDAEDIAYRTRMKYKKIKATGHSLGGTQALHVNKKYGIDAVAFNPGSGLFGGYEADNHQRDNARIVRNPGDIIARNAVGKNVKHVKSGGGGWKPWVQGLLENHRIF